MQREEIFFFGEKKYIEMYFSREHVRRIVTGNSRIKRNKKINEIHIYFLKTINVIYFKFGKVEMKKKRELLVTDDAIFVHRTNPRGFFFYLSPRVCREAPGSAIFPFNLSHLLKFFLFDYL